MSQIREKDIIKVQITGIQKYGAFANIDNNYNGLIQISEISYGYVKNINDYINIGDNIYAEVKNIDNNTKKIKLSIKDIDYKKNGEKLKRMAETKSGFEPLKDNLDDKKSNKRWESFIHAPIIPLITVDFQLVNLPYYYGL